MLKIAQQLKISIFIFFILTLMVGVIYPLVITCIGQVFFHNKVNGSMIVKNGEIIGSELIGQYFNDPKYFFSRPIGPSDATFGNDKNTPIDLLTSSASGLDPHITPEAAEYQIDRISKIRSVSEEKIQQLVNRYTEPRQLGFLGQERVNVLKLNIALDEI